MIGIHYRPLGIDVLNDGTAVGRLWVHQLVKCAPSDEPEPGKYSRMLPLPPCCASECFFLLPKR